MSRTLVLILFFTFSFFGAVQARDPRCMQQPIITKQDVGALLVSIERAEEQLKTDFGAAVFTGAPELRTAAGLRTIGDVWSEYLTKFGYPTDYSVRQCLAADLIAMGMDDAAGFVLVSGQTNSVAIRHLKNELAKMR